MNLLDSIIGYVAPAWGAQRLEARALMSQINAVMGTGVGYANAQKTRLNRPRSTALVKDHALPQQQYQNLTVDSWTLYRDKPYVRKLVNSLISKVIGKGMSPKPTVVNDDGSANVAFNQRAAKLWSEVQDVLDWRGLPGSGGQTLSGIQRLALKATILSGNVFYRLVPIDGPERLRRESPVGLAIQLLDMSRLAADQDVPADQVAEGNQLYRGIELDVTGKRVAYWFNAIRPGEATPAFRNAKRRSAQEIGHLFVEDDIDQYIGTPWMCSVTQKIRDIDDLEHNVLKQSSMAACVVGSYSLPNGSVKFGLNATDTNLPTADGSDLTDADGNKISRIQPAMMVNTSGGGEFKLHSPNQPNLNPEAFVQHMLRSVAAGLPGMKGSSLTGDYRNSSFSSEKAADNDCWPEIEAVQDWFASSFIQPIYDRIVRDAVFYKYFDGIVTSDEFTANPSRFTACQWQGPVRKSINEVDDVKAAAERVRAGQSSLQMECSKLSVDWQQVLRDGDELYQQAKALGLPDEVVNNYLGVDANDVIAVANANAQGAANA